MKPFDKTYWDKNYSDPKSMDGIGNAKSHVRYLKAFLDLEHVDVSSIVDLGFGYGYLFHEMLQRFLPYRALGIEPSSYAFKKVSRQQLMPVKSMKLTLRQQDLKTWCKSRAKKSDVFDLGICTSVFQYLSDKELKEVVPVLAKRVKYLYLTVPTDLELKRQVEDLEFKDEFAIHRSRKQYQRLLSPHFTFLSARVLESKFFFNEKTTSFTDLLYRF